MSSMRSTSACGVGTQTTSLPGWPDCGTNSSFASDLALASDLAACASAPCCAGSVAAKAATSAAAKMRAEAARESDCKNFIPSSDKKRAPENVGVDPADVSAAPAEP